MRVTATKSDLLVAKGWPSTGKVRAGVSLGACCSAERTGPGARAAYEKRATGPRGSESKEPEPADKPGSVVDNHSSGTAVTSDLKRPTRRHRGPRHGLPIWSCSEWGLPCHSVLPPARCALTAPFHPYPNLWGGIFSVALSVGSRPPGVTWHPALWSPDFPPSPK